MTTAQKIIKYLALGFALFLTITIISSILGVIYGLANILGLRNNDSNKELGNIEWEQTSNLTTYLDIDVKYTNLTLKTGEKFSAQSSSKDIEIQQNGNKLKIEDKSRHNWLSNNDAENLIIYIPQELEFEKVEIDTGAGKVDVEALQTEKLKFNLGAGETIIQNVVANEADIDTGAGKLTIENGKLNDLDFDMGVGETNIKTELTGKNKIDTGIGSLKLNLLGNKEDYKIKLSKGLGDIKIDGKSASNDETIGSGENYIDIDGGIGEIKVDFKGE